MSVSDDGEFGVDSADGNSRAHGWSNGRERGLASRATYRPYVVALMAAAATDLGVLRPAKLYRRFVAWTLPSGTRCRACRSHRHDLLPDIPPRLFPCPDLP